MPFPSLNDLVGKAKSAFNRFPLTLLWAICGTLYTILSVDGTLGKDTDTQTKIIITLVLGVSWMIGAQFFIEQQKNPKKWIWLKPTLLLLLFLFYWHIPAIDVFNESPVYITRFFLFLIAGHLFVFFAPFANTWNKSAYWNYLNTLGSSILRSGFFSGVLYIGLILALSAIDSLFGVRVNGDLYFQVFLFCLGIVNTWIYLSDFPRDIHEQTEIRFKKPLEVFVKYILIPLIVLYILILYAYTAKIMIQWELPQGWVSYLVTALALLGFVVQIIINPVQKKSDSWTIAKFHPWFYRLMLPLVGLLFIAIFRRISDYGITENRYFVVVIAFWILGATLFLLFNKTKKLILLPLSLFVLALLASFGFWVVVSVSERSQVAQFQKIYANALKNEKITSSDEYRQLKSILKYLEERDVLTALDETTGVSMAGMYMNGTVDGTKGNHGWLNPKKVLDSLGLTLENGALTGSDALDYYYYHSDDLSLDYSITGYQNLVSFQFWNNYEKKDTFIGDYQINYNPTNFSIELFNKIDTENSVLQIPFKNRLIALSKNKKDLNKVDQKEFMIQVENDSLKAMLIFRNLNFYMENESVNLSNAKTFILLEQK